MNTQEDGKEVGHTGLELCAKTTGNRPLCEEGGAKSGAVVADEVLESIVANWQHLPEHIKLAIQALVRAGESHNGQTVR